MSNEVGKVGGFEKKDEHYLSILAQGSNVLLEYSELVEGKRLFVYQVHAVRKVGKRDIVLSNGLRFSVSTGLALGNYTSNKLKDARILPLTLDRRKQINEQRAIRKLTAQLVGLLKTKTLSSNKLLTIIDIVNE